MLQLSNASGDIFLSAPNGRIHFVSQHFSREVGSEGAGVISSDGAGHPAPAPAPATGSGNGFLSGVAAFGSGLYEGAVKPLVDLVEHPIQAAEGLGHAIAHPITTAEALGHAIYTGSAQALSGDPHAIGLAMGTVGSMLVPGAGEAEAVGDAAKVSEVAKVAEAAEVADAAKAAELGEAGEAAKVGTAAAGKPAYARNGDCNAPRDWAYQPSQIGRIEPGTAPKTPALEQAISESRARIAPPVPEGWPTLSDDVAKTFGADPVPTTYPPGTKLYRVIGNDKSSVGSFWAPDPPPVSEAEWRSSDAVLDEWNGDGGYVVHTVGPNELNAWSGPIAPQTIDPAGTLVLPGGGTQVWVPRGTLLPDGPPMPTPWNLQGAN